MGSSSGDFEKLERLLKLKRYEQPPPRYFNEFSGRVLDRIAASEAEAARSWWNRWTPSLAPQRPAWAMGLGALGCGVLAYGVISFFASGPVPNVPAWSGVATPVATTSAHSMLTLQATGEADVVFSTNPVLTPDRTLFPIDGARIRAEPVNFTPNK